MSLSAQVTLALFLGIASGLFFGEAAGSLRVLGDAFIRLLQVTVLPYILVSLVSGLGSLGYREARGIAITGGAAVLILWGLALLGVVLMPLAFPDWDAASFFSASLLAEAPPFDFLGLYIPSNPFQALSEAVVPAIVVFSVALGIALIGVENKERFIEPLDVAQEALMRLTQAIARLAPIGVFALTASAAGTLRLQEFARLQVFVVTYCALALVIAFWALPALVSTLTPVRYRDVLGRTRGAMLTAFATGSLLIVLPMLAEKTKELLAEVGLGSDDAQATVDVVVPASFNFPAAGKLLQLGFLPFAAWFIGSDIAFADYPAFLLSGVASFFGSSVIAVPFLLEQLRLPADMFGIFVTLDVVFGRFSILVGAIHVVALSLLVPFALANRLHFRPVAITRYGAITLGLVFGTVLGARAFFATALEPSYDKHEIFMEMEGVEESVEAVVHESTRTGIPSGAGAPRIDAIGVRGSLRVGYFPDALPYVFKNASGALVGFDVDLARDLARSLGASLEFVPLDFATWTRTLRTGRIDIAMSGLAVTMESAKRATFSTPYTEETLALLMEDHRRDEFQRWDEIARIEGLRLGMPDAPHYAAIVRSKLPNAEIVTIESPRAFVRGEQPDLDAFVYLAQTGSAWTLIHPRYSVVVPRPAPLTVPVAFGLPPGDRPWRDFVNAWVDLRKRDGTIERIYEHWILGKDAERTTPRWSVIRDVLHWVE